MEKATAMLDLKNASVLGPLVEEVEKQIEPVHKAIERTAEYNQYRVLQSFRRHRVSESHFIPSTGYGYDDYGRETLEAVYADCFGAESALVRPQIMSGTHAITLSLFGVLRPGDELLYITGKPYDTLEKVIGASGDGTGSLRDFGIGFRYVPLADNGFPDYPTIREAISERTKVIGIQRSRGYADRPSFTIAEIREMIRFVKEIKEDCIVFVDNCYGEFVEEKEPCHVGADLIAGSLIKNPGGGIVKTGGYIAGKKELVEKCANRLASPGIGRKGGATLYSLLEMYQGFFLAPHAVSQALKGAVFTAAVLEKLGMKTNPAWNEKRTDIIQSIQFSDPKRMVSFCQAIQSASPVNAHVLPEPSEMPGYSDEVIMAAGTFIQGASLELTADGPIRPPYIVYMQGGLTYEHVKLAVCAALDRLLEQGLASPAR